VATTFIGLNSPVCISRHNFSSDAQSQPAGKQGAKRIAFSEYILSICFQIVKGMPLCYKRLISNVKIPACGRPCTVLVQGRQANVK